MTGPLLIFGAGGQIGQAVLESARQRQVFTIGVTRSEADIANADAVKRLVDIHAPRLILNAAAYTAVDKAESEPDLARLVNAGGAEIVAQAAAGAGVPLIHMSTNYVFDGTKSEPYAENDRIGPISVYGRTKAEGEARVLAAMPDAVVLRTAWVYGPYGSNFLKTILRLASQHDRLRVVIDQRGSPTATIDIAEAVFRIHRAAVAREWSSGIFHFAGFGNATWHSFAEAIMTAQALVARKHTFIDPILSSEYHSAAKRPVNSALSSNLFSQTFGYRAPPWQVRVNETVLRLIQIGDEAEE
jgi:dTDP-4-dehydrorhamnose reductase